MGSSFAPQQWWTTALSTTRPSPASVPHRTRSRSSCPVRSRAAPPATTSWYAASRPMARSGSPSRANFRPRVLPRHHCPHRRSRRRRHRARRRRRPLPASHLSRRLVRPTPHPVRARSRRHPRPSPRRRPRPHRLPSRRRDAGRATTTWAGRSSHRPSTWPPSERTRASSTVPLASAGPSSGLGRTVTGIGRRCLRALRPFTGMRSTPLWLGHCPPLTAPTQPI
mmetsp:Transcript_28993/g.77985  ORF Transcript_28993/g.77985 Transcript_28993/m.77985 type:complete len:224 (+) Transcript_28993:486-1157(+)